MGYCISLNATEILSAPQNALYILFIFDLVIYLPTYRVWVHMTEVAAVMLLVYSTLSTSRQPSFCTYFYVLSLDTKLYVCRNATMCASKCHGGECNPIAWWYIMHSLHLYTVVWLHFTQLVYKCECDSLIFC